MRWLRCCCGAEQRLLLALGSALHFTRVYARPNLNYSHTSSQLSKRRDLGSSILENARETPRDQNGRKPIFPIHDRQLTNTPFTHLAPDGAVPKSSDITRLLTFLLSPFDLSTTTFRLDSFPKEITIIPNRYMTSLQWNIKHVSRFLTVRIVS